MNAHEAIGWMEIRLNDERMSMAAYEADKDRDPFTLMYLQNKTEALNERIERIKSKRKHEEGVANESP